MTVPPPPPPPAAAATAPWRGLPRLPTLSLTSVSAAMMSARFDADAAATRRWAMKRRIIKAGKERGLGAQGGTALGAQIVGGGEI